MKKQFYLTILFAFLIVLNIDAQRTQGSRTSQNSQRTSNNQHSENQRRQNIVYQSNNRVSVSLNNQNSPYGTGGAHVLQLLAQGSRSGSSYSSSINFSFNETKKIERLGRSLHFTAEISSFALNGNYSYKLFNVTNSIKPGQIAFTAEWRDPRASRIIKKYDYKVNLGSSVTKLFDFSQTDTLYHAAYKLYISNYQLIFDNRSITELENRIKLIDEYYRDAKYTSDLLRTIQSIRIDDYEKINNNLDKLNNAKQNFAAISRKNYERKLDLGRNDPENILTNLNQLENRINNKYTKIQQIKSQLPEIYLNKGKNEASRGNAYNAEQFYNKALLENNNYAPAKLELARVNYNKGNIGVALSLISEIKSSNSADYNTQKGSEELVNNIYTQTKRQIKQDIAYKKYEQAIQSIEQTRQLCREFSISFCSSDLDALMSEAVQGEFKEKESSARASFSAGNLTQCETKLSELDLFYRNYSSYLSYDALSLLWNRLYNEYISKANRNLNFGKYQNTIQNTQNARRLCNEVQWISCTTDLNKLENNAYLGIYKQMLKQTANYLTTNSTVNANNKLIEAISFRKVHAINKDPQEQQLSLSIQQNLYNEYVENAYNFEKSGQYKSALKEIDKAVQIENNYSINKQNGLKNSIYRNVSYLANEFIERAKNLVSQNDLNKAKNKISEVEYLLKQYNVAKTDGIYNQLSEVKNSIYSVKCQGFEDEYNLMVDNARTLVDSKKFINADAAFDKAINYAKQKAECAIDFADAETYKEEIKAPKYFVLQLKEINNLINYNINEDAILKYLDLEKYYKENNLQNFELKYSDLYEFAKTQNERFVIYVIKHSLEENEAQKGFELLKELKKRNIRKSYTKMSQTLLGEEFARKDFEANRYNDPKKKVLEYVYGDSWYGYFTKSYIKQWKKFK